LVFYRNILLYVKLRNNKMKKEFKLSDEEIIKKILEEVKCGYSSSQREYEFDAMISSMTKRVLEIKEKEFKEFIKLLKNGFVYKEDGEEKWYTKEDIVEEIDKLTEEYLK